MEIKCAYTELINPSELKPHPKNRNQHTDEQLKLLSKLIGAHGFRHPIIVSNLSGCIVAGHGRLEAARSLKMDAVPVDYQDFKDEAAEYQFLISDNEIAHLAKTNLSQVLNDVLDFGPDFDMSLLGIPDFKLPEEFEAKSDEDDVPEHVEPKTKLGDLYVLGRHRLLCGDSTSVDAVEKLMDGKKADMVFTDPPYGISIVKGSVGGDKAFGSVGGGKIVKANKYREIIGDNTTDAARDVYNLCVGLDIKTLIFWGGNHYSEYLPSSSCWIVWDKQNTGNFADAELAWTNQKSAVRIFKHMWNGMIKASEHGQKRVHPTQKPIALAEWCFNEYNDPENVMDLFGGSGSTLVACEKTNRSCFMMELDPHYCDVIVARWEKYTGKKAELAND